MRSLLCAALVVGCLARVAAADDEPKSEGTAFALSLGAGVVAPLVLIGAARSGSGLAPIDGVIITTMIGPTLGHWYAGRAWTNATSIRLLAGVTGLYSGVIVLTDDCETASCTHDDKIAAAVVVVSLGAIVATTLYDVGTAPRSAREYNAAHHVIVAPVAMPAAGGHTAIGLGFGGTF